MRRAGPVTFVLLASTFVSACGARTVLDVSSREDDASVTADASADAGRDAGRDSGVDSGVDAGRDSGMIPSTGPCARDADCDIGVCRGAVGFSPADLANHPLECGPTDPDGGPVGAPCSSPTQCGRGLCSVSGVCVEPCRTDVDCDAGERCRQVFVPTSARSMQPVLACTALVAAPDGVRVVGPEPGPTLSGGMDAGEDALPALGDDALVIWTGAPASTPFIARIATRRPPATVFDAFEGGDPRAPAPDWGVSPLTVTDAATLLYPNGPGTPDSGRGFDVTFGASSPTPLERYVAQRSAPGRVFDVDAYLVGGGGWTARGGVAPPDMRRALADAGAALASAGIVLGEIRVHEVVGALRERYGVLEGAAGPAMVPEELDDLYALTAGQNRPAIPIFFVRSIEGALGIASGIPGPHVLPGTGASGVAISVDLVPVDEMGVVIAHELGHYTGLFHTSEIDGRVNDPFPDTPECRLDRDTDGDGFLRPSECRGAGADHLMFWAGRSPTVSAGQAELMRRAYFVR